MERKETSSNKSEVNGKDFVMALDVGSTVVRVFIFNEKAEIVTRVLGKLTTLYPEPGRVEQDAEDFISECKAMLQKALKESGIPLSRIKSLGITTQRGCLVTWNKKTGKPLHNIISWLDTRSEAISQVANQSYTVYGLQNLAKFVWFFTRQERLASASDMNFSTALVCTRLAWVLQNNSEAQRLQKEGNLMFGTADSWLLYNLTGGKVHATDYSNISATGLWDPFEMTWNVWAFRILNLPYNILPEVRDTSGNFGECVPSIFGEENKVSLPITALAGDQMAAMFGECCFSKGETKCTIGTGCFVNINTGNTPYASKQGLYPLIGWKIGKETVFMTEATAQTAGSAVEWAIDCGFLQSAEESEKLASSVKDTNGCVFVHAFKGLIHPYGDDTARSSLVGLNRSTRKEHIVRAILEGIAFTAKDLITTIEEDIPIPITSLKVDGGVSQNNFVIQFAADMLNKDILRAKDHEMTAQGIAFLAGLGSGLWKSKEEVAKLKSGLNQVFQVNSAFSSEDRKTRYAKWKKAVARSLFWEEH